MILKKAMSDPLRARNIGWRIIQDWLEAMIAVKTLDQYIAWFGVVIGLAWVFHGVGFHLVKL